MSANPQEGEVFKVVRPIEANIFGSTNSIPGWSIEYKPGEPATPTHRNSCLFAFLLQSDAEEFALKESQPRIWRAVARGIEDPTRLIPYSDDQRDMNRYWRAHRIRLSNLRLTDLGDHYSNVRKLYLSYGSGMYTPRGTVFCRSLTLLEQVK